MRPRLTNRTRGFTLIEVMFAALLMSVVGMAILGFISAFARGIETRSTMNDPALESSLAARRLETIAPGFCWVLRTDASRAAIWLSDSVPSRSVHLSELGLVRFDADEGELVFDIVNPEAFSADPTLDVELLLGPTTDFIGAMEAQRALGRTLRHILAEGIDAVSCSTTSMPAGTAAVTITMPSGSARIPLSPSFPMEPLR